MVPAAKAIKEWLAIEKQALNVFQRQAHLHLPTGLLVPTDDVPNVLDWWTLMAHYSAPTRLIDWTKSGYVAAYFTVYDLANSNHDGAVLAVNLPTVHRWMHEHQGQAALPDIEQWNDYFLSDSPPVCALHFVQRPRESDRMIAQQGMFSVSPNVVADHGQCLNQMERDTGEAALVQFIIPHRLKFEFLRRLVRLNVTANALFPGPDGLGRSIAELIRLEANA